MDWHPGEHEDLMRREDAETGTDKDNELVAIEGLELPTVQCSRWFALPPDDSVLVLAAT